MKTDELLKIFKTKKNISSILNINRSAVSLWGDYVPIDRQYELEVKTGGLVKSDYTVNKEKNNENS
ncbi:Cro/CI family transcriptional regulator (plasmid) [Orbus sturtevantii]|uniref:Cro/CI family transcriptional regulator n=1 Tax=Orbus sturtevantii TaxID=3074109 RepID=UPI00370D6C74